MRKNERKHTEKKSKKNRKNWENELAKSPRIVQIGSIGRKRPRKSEVVRKLSKTAQVSENNCN